MTLMNNAERATAFEDSSSADADFRFIDEVSVVEIARKATSARIDRVLLRASAILIAVVPIGFMTLGLAAFGWGGQKKPSLSAPPNSLRMISIPPTAEALGKLKLGSDSTREVDAILGAPYLTATSSAGDQLRYYVLCELPPATPEEQKTAGARSPQAVEAAATIADLPLEKRSSENSQGESPLRMARLRFCDDVLAAIE